MGWPGRRAAPHDPVRYRRSLLVVTSIAGFLALGSTLAAFAASDEFRAIVEIFQGSTAVDWTRFGFDATATRNNPAETRIKASNVADLRLKWRSQLPDIADSAPAFLHGLRFPDGSARDVLYLTTKSGGLVAVDADSGALLWRSPSLPVDPNKPTTSSPLADADRGVVYSYGLDGKVHEYDAVTGAETRGGGWPVTITTMKDSEKGSSALNAANGYLYVTTASFGGDAPPYQGHVVTIRLSDGATHVFNALCSDRARLLAPSECRSNGAGIWARPGAVVDPLTGNIFVTTGNGPYTADRGGYDWGDSVLELTPDGTRLVDSYTPGNPDDLYTQDLDLGSAAPALLPAIPASAAPYLAIQAGKEGQLRLLNRRNLSGRGGPGHLGGELQTVDAPNHCPVLTQPAVWADPAGGAVWVLVASSCAIGGYQVSAAKDGSPAMRLAWTVPVGATSPIIAGGVLFAATTGDKEILALDPRTGRQLWTSRAARAGGSIGYIHWESPIVVNGRLYCADEDGDLLAYGL